MIRTVLRPAVRSLALIALLLCVQTVSFPAVRAQGSEAYALVDAVNGYREAHGLPRLPTSDALMVAAQRHAEWMAANFSYSHTGAGGSSPQDRAAAAGFGGTVRENVGGGSNASTAWMVQYWDQTYIHQVAMRDTSATHLGAGSAANGGQVFFVLLIGGASAQPPPPPPPQPVAQNNPPAAASAPQTAASSSSVSSSQRQAAAHAARIASIETIQRAEPAEDGSIVHVVEAGQTAWAIATRYDVALHEILALNRISEHSVLQPGDRLIIRPGPTPEPTEPSVYTVQGNDSLWIIAARHNKSVEELLEWNSLTELDVIQPGDVLIIAPPTPVPTATDIPTSTPTSTPSPTATVVPTDTVAPTLAPPVTEVAQLATPVPDVPEESAAAAENNTRSVALIAFVGMVAVMAAMAGSVALWFVLGNRRKAKL